MRRSCLFFIFGLAVLWTLPTFSLAGTLDPPMSGTLSDTQRFVVVMDGMGVLDNETGLTWQLSPITTTKNWSEARVQCIVNTAISNRRGWRLPAINELSSLLDTANTNPALPTGHPFTNIVNGIYWSISTNPDNPAEAWWANLGTGAVLLSHKWNNQYHTICVRGGSPGPVDY
ncbi:MAG: DUF1566 domain-containing protein [Nitrospirales bacterium]|nr:DUF1566 domain-containing protein [Nitrospira sp.]MDR4502635.1 DUF1566 domain-containing protein [Nitrospirales bacterium]